VHEPPLDLPGLLRVVLLHHGRQRLPEDQPRAQHVALGALPEEAEQAVELAARSLQRGHLRGEPHEVGADALEAVPSALLGGLDCLLPLELIV